MCFDPPQNSETEEQGACAAYDNPPGCTPLILDLNGDGIWTTALEVDPVLFDMSGDGVKTLTAWTNPNTEEGILYFDHNRNGVIDDGTELFGDRTTLPSGDMARHGFIALAQYDRPGHGGNGDGRISLSDGVWGKLRVWVDRSHDGIMTPDENYSLAQLRIAEISLNFTAMDESTSFGLDAAGNYHLLQGYYQKRSRGPGAPDGADIFSIHDVFFRGY